MEGVPATTGNSGDDGGSAESQQQPPQPHENGGGGGGNRWPKQETLALIKIRSEMDTAFRDSNLKGPLWDNVSRKLSELGFHRSAKKCREKFENVSKYHRRTKEGRTSKSDKIYRFSDQLQALETNPRTAFPPVAGKPPPVLVEMCNNSTLPLNYNMTTGSDQNNVSPISVAAPAVMAPPVMNHKRTFSFSQPNMNNSASSSSDTSSNDEPSHKKKKWEDFFGKLMKEVINKQEELQMRFLKTLERRERDRVAREEAWRAQEIAKMNQEHERLVLERSIVATKDAAVITFLQKMTGKDTDEARKKLPDLLTPPMALVSTIPPVLPQQQIHQTAPQPQPQPQPQREVPPVAVPPPRVVKNLESGVLSPSPSRWPKAEINALINVRRQLDIKYQENVPKGPLWEEISAGMRNIGYNRNAKRCKEKWENINKYYKKMKEGNTKRSGDSKTCPYFDQLDAIYREKSTPIIAQPEKQWPPPQQQQRDDAIYIEKDNSNVSFAVKPEQQWRLPTVLQETPKQPGSDMENEGSENDDDDDDDDDCYDDEDKEDEGGNGEYEIVANKMSSMAGV